MTLMTKTKVAGSTKSEVRALDDRELIDRVIARDDAAWKEFMRRYQPKIRGAIFSVLKKYAPVLNSDAREDILQDFYLSLLDRDAYKLRVFDPKKGRNLGSWLNLLACNSAFDHARKIVSHPRTSDIDDLIEEQDRASEEHEHDDSAIEDRAATKHDVLDAHVWWKAAQATKKAEREARYTNKKEEK
jgi:RNA polymerase sigma-70 factor (ECF subfamily)